MLTVPMTALPRVVCILSYPPFFIYRVHHPYSLYIDLCGDRNCSSSIGENCTSCFVDCLECCKCSSYLSLTHALCCLLNLISRAAVPKWLSPWSLLYWNMPLRRWILRTNLQQKYYTITHPSLQILIFLLRYSQH